MQRISTLSFAQMKNAEHVSFFNNVQVAIDKVGATKVGLTDAQMSAYKYAVFVEQDIVNHSTASIYTPEMKALDDERDRLFRLLRLKLQAVTLASSTEEVAQYAVTVDKYILSKYGLDICGAPYQEESALIRGFILDMNARFPDDALEVMGVATELAALNSANESFADQYNERVTEKSGSTTENTRKARAATEELFHLIGLSLEYKANNESATEVGQACDGLVAVINELIKDARLRLNVRLGKVEEPKDSEDNPVISPVPFPTGK